MCLPPHLLVSKTPTGVAAALVPAGETWGQLLIFKSFRVSLLLATSTFSDGSSTGVSSILSEDSDLELTNTTVKAEMKWDCRRNEKKCRSSYDKGVKGVLRTVLSSCILKAPTNRRTLNWPANVRKPWEMGRYCSNMKLHWQCKAAKCRHNLDDLAICSCDSMLQQLLWTGVMRFIYLKQPEKSVDTLVSVVPLGQNLYSIIKEKNI